MDAFLDDIGRKRLPIEDDIGFKNTSTGAMRDAMGFDVVQGFVFAATQAMVMEHRAMEFIDGFRTRQRMKAIDVLGQDGDIVVLFITGQGEMGFVGLGIRKDHVLPIEFIEFFRMGIEVVARKDFLGGKVPTVGLVIKS